MDVIFSQKQTIEDYQQIEAAFDRMFLVSPTSKCTCAEIKANLTRLYFFIVKTPVHTFKEYDFNPLLISSSQGWSKSYSLALFEKHFITRFCLYFFAKYSTLLTIDIQLVSISVCLSKGKNTPHLPCDIRQGSAHALEAFYFDWSQFNNATEQTVDTLLGDFWQRFEQTQHVDKDLVLLQISKPKDQVRLADIKNAYRLQAQANHPDKGGCSDTFDQIQQAYQRLKQCYI